MLQAAQPRLLCLHVRPAVLKRGPYYAVLCLWYVCRLCMCALPLPDPAQCDAAWAPGHVAAPTSRPHTGMIGEPTGWGPRAMGAHSGTPLRAGIVCSSCSIRPLAGFVTGRSAFVLLVLLFADPPAVSWGAFLAPACCTHSEAYLGFALVHDMRPSPVACALSGRVGCQPWSRPHLAVVVIACACWCATALLAAAPVRPVCSRAQVWALRGRYAAVSDLQSAKHASCSTHILFAGREHCLSGGLHWAH